MTPEVFEAIRAAVNITRNEQVRTVAVLRIRLRQSGFADPVIESALAYWASRA